MSVTTRPSTESPRNSIRSFVTVVPCSNAYDRCVSAASRSAASRNDTSRARSSDSSGTSTAELTRLFDLDRLAAGVVTAVAAHAMRELGLVALGALGVGGRLAFPVRGPPVASRLALLLLGNGHGGSSSFLVADLSEQLLERRPSRVIGRLGAFALPQVAVAAAATADPEALGPAQRRERQLEADRVADHLIGVQPPVGAERVHVCVFIRGVDREELVDLEVERPFEFVEAARAAKRQRSVNVSGGEDPFDDRLKQQIADDRLPRGERRELGAEPLHLPSDPLGA